MRVISNTYPELERAKTNVKEFIRSYEDPQEDWWDRESMFYDAMLGAEGVMESPHNSYRRLLKNFKENGASQELLKDLKYVYGWYNKSSSEEVQLKAKKLARELMKLSESWGLGEGRFEWEISSSDSVRGNLHIFIFASGDDSVGISGNSIIEVVLNSVGDVVKYEFDEYVVEWLEEDGEYENVKREFEEIIYKS